MRKITILLAFLLFAGLQGAFAQKSITGKVTSSDDGLGIPGVTVVVKGTAIGTATDMDGAFKLSVPANAVTLVISFIGMKTVELPIGSQTVFNVELSPDIRALEDVVVTAFGISRQSKALTYAAQNVKSEALAEARSLNVVSGLSGRIAGLSITTASTGVGAEAKVLLRGNRSINGSSEPLYVVDGITLGGGISNLSPDDIVSISVLKGANAAALYGSRANNGAIIITTKSGVGAKEGVTTNLGFTWQGSSAIFLDKMQNEYGQGGNGIYSPDAIVSWGSKMDGSQVAHWSNDPNYSMFGKTYAYSPQPDNFRDYFRNGNSFATNLQVSINNKNSNAAFSYTNTNASGIVATNNLKSHNLSIRYGSKIGEKLTVDSKVNVIRQAFQNQFATGEGFNNPMRYLYVLPRNIRTEDIQHYQFINAAGQNRQHYWRWNDNGTGNAYWTRYNVERPENRERIISMVSLKYQVIKDLSIMGRSAIDETFTRTEEKMKNDTYTQAINGGYSKTNSSYYDWNTDVLVNYHKVLSDITFDLNAGANTKTSEWQQIGGSGVVFNIENLFALGNTANPRPYEGYSKKIVNSVYGFGELSYKNAIFLNITGRNDWSSALPAASRSYFYPSLGLTAVLNELITLPEIFTHVKLRGSFAQVGNDTDPYQLARTASISNGMITLSNVLPNANLKPETTKSLEVGFDLRMLKDRIRLSLTYYKTNTINQLFSTPVPATSGVASVFQNGADVQNKGLEITLGAAVISTNDFSWDIDINWSKNNSEILKIAEGFDVLSFGRDFIRDYQLRVGSPFGDVYSKGWLRDDAGNVIIQANGLPAITPGMTVNTANYAPDWLAGISNTFKYKSFTFSSLIDIRQGGTFISITEAISAGSGIQDYTAVGREDGSLLFGRDVFKGEKGVTTDGAVNTATTNAESFWNNVGGRNNPVGEAFVRDASNVRMREVILGYELPKSIVSKTFFSSARVSLVGRNLFFFSNKAKYVDPEVMMSTDNTSEGESSFALPTTRTYGVSLNFGF
ncbi:MAG: SusC/RagA family TonB-linked outer membrane protein [Bacteroidota bacterium]